MLKTYRATDNLLDWNAILPHVTPDTAYVIVTDGAGLQLRDQGGYAAIIYQIASRQYGINFGSCAYTTNNRMELQAVLSGVFFMHNIFKAAHGDRALILSDSEYVVKIALDEWTRKSNGDLWLLFDYWRTRYTLDFRHINRDSIAAPDHISKWASRDARELKRFLLSDSVLQWEQEERDWRSLRDAIQAGSE